MSRYVAGFDLSHTMSAMVWLDAKFKVVYQVRSPISIEPEQTKVMRAWRLYYKWIDEKQIQLAAIEKAIPVPKKPKITIGLIELGTMLKFSVQSKGIPWCEDYPNSIRKEIMNNGAAKKPDVRKFLNENYNIYFEDDKGSDLYDAALAAVWGMKHLQRGR